MKRNGKLSFFVVMCLVFSLIAGTVCAEDEAWKNGEWFLRKVNRDKDNDGTIDAVEKSVWDKQPFSTEASGEDGPSAAVAADDDAGNDSGGGGSGGCFIGVMY